MQLIGQKSNLDIIDKWKEVPNFIIIQGAEHTGKSYLTLYISQKFNLKYNKVKNGVNDIRRLLDVMGKGTNQLFHFDNFDKASIQAKNALLKITEEPVPGNYIVITGGSQIKTLESRARRIVMQPYSYDEMKPYMDKYIQMDDLHKKNLYNAGVNTPAKVQYYNTYENLNDLLDYAYEIFYKITYIEPNVYIPLISRFEDRYEQGKVDACLLFIDMLLGILETNIKEKGYYSYQLMVNELLSAKNALLKEPTLRRKMLLFRTFHNMEQIK